MIIDNFTHALTNPCYPDAIRRALAGIQAQHPTSLSVGKYPIEGDGMFFTVMEGETQPLTERQPEYHRQYIDIHLVLAGEEVVGAGVAGLPITPTRPFDSAHDIGFCTTIESETLIHLQPGELAIVFPQELHRPMATCAAPAPLRKIVAKIDIALLG